MKQYLLLLHIADDNNGMKENYAQIIANNFLQIRCTWRGNGGLILHGGFVLTCFKIEKYMSMFGGILYSRIIALQAV